MSIGGKRDLEGQSEGRHLLMEAMADAKVRVVISVLGALWKKARNKALIGPAVAVLFATAQL